MSDNEATAESTSDDKVNQVEDFVMRTLGYKVVSDEFISSLFEGENFGATINDSVDEKRKLIAKTLRNQVDGYWSGHTAYHIVVNGGFLHDAKPGEEKRLTALGNAYMTEYT